MSEILIALTVLLGAAMAYRIDAGSKLFKYILSFSGAFLLGILFTGLIPGLFHTHAHDAINMGWWIIAGFLIQILLDFLSQGLEHGHHHHQQIKVTALIGLFLHAFLEGTPLHGHNHGNEPLLIGIILHKLPIAILVVSALRNTTISSMALYSSILIFALATPMGIMVAEQPWALPYLQPLTGIAAGLLLHVSTTILFETSQNHRFNAIKMAVVIVGIAAAAGVEQLM